MLHRSGQSRHDAPSSRLENPGPATAHPAVSAVAAVGLPDAVPGERVCCYLVPASGATPLTVADRREYLLRAGIAARLGP